MDRPVRGDRGRGDDRRAAACVPDLAHRDGRSAAGEEMTKGDALVEKGATRLQRLANRAARSGGLRSRLAQPLAEDAAFLRKLKPSLVVARAKGEAPTNQEPGADVVAPSAPQLGKRPRRRGGPNPFLVVGVALVAGIALAKIVDWRSHAHPRD
jgi:hypothetical protein